MAPGLKRAAVYTPLACALLALALLPPKERRQEPPSPAPRTDIRAARQLSEATDRLRLLTLRDSVVRALASRSAISEDSLVFVVDPGLPAKVGAALRGLMTPLWARATDGASQVRGVVVVEVDTGYVWRGANSGRSWTRVSHVLPEATDGRTCISHVAVGVRDARRIAESGRLTAELVERFRAELLGACGFYAAFGNPGEGVREWLARQAYLPAARSSWVFVPLWDHEFDPRWLHFGYVECAAGRLESCREILWKRPGDDRRSVRFTEFDVPGVVVGSPFFDWRDPLGPRGPTYLTDMVAHYGRERIARFWTSSAPLEAAFLEATGEPMSVWTQQWARAFVGVPDVGTRTRPRAALLSMVLVVAAVGAAGALSRLRQAG